MRRTEPVHSLRVRSWRVLAVAVAVLAALMLPSVPAWAIIGGADVTVDPLSPIRAVVKVDVVARAGNTVGNCTGTLIASTWILTAQHCTNIDEKQGSPASNGQMKIRVLNGNKADRTSYDVSAIHRMDGYNETSGVNDIALIRVSKPVQGARAMPLLDGSYFSSVRDIYRYGYGPTSTGSTNVTSLPRRAHEHVLAGEELSVPPASRCSSAGWSAGIQLWTTPIDGGSRKGDSGGPATFDVGGGKLAVVGVTEGTCGSTDPVNQASTFLGISNRADSSSAAGAWIRGVVGSALPAPVRPPAQNPPPTQNAPPTQNPPTPAPIPATPALTAGAPTTTSIPLSWSRQTGAVGYKIYQDRGSTPIRTVTDPTTSATITGLASNTTFTFEVTAYNASGESVRSNAVSVTTLPTWTMAFVSQSAVDSLGATADLGHARPGQRFAVTITVRNTGTATWSSGGSSPVLLGTAQPDDHAGALQAPGWVSANLETL